VAENTGETTFGVASVQSVNISVTKGVGDNFDSYLTFLGGGNPNILNFHGLLGSVGNGGFTKNRLWLCGVHRILKLKQQL